MAIYDLMKAPGTTKPSPFALGIPRLAAAARGDGPPRPPEPARPPVTRGTPSALAAAADAPAADPATPRPPPQNFMDGLLKFIPTEIVGVYIAVVSVMRGSTDLDVAWAMWVVYFLFVAITPAVAIAIWCLSAEESSLWKAVVTAPRFKIFAATASFAVWGFAVADLSESGIAQTLSGVATIVVPFVLQVGERLAAKYS